MWHVASVSQARWKFIFVAVFVAIFVDED